jgi:hypothetical protein
VTGAAPPAAPAAAGGPEAELAGGALGSPSPWGLDIALVGLGPIGAAIGRQLLRRGARLGAATDLDPAKVGRDLGDLLGIPQLGVVVSDALPAPPPAAGRRAVLVHAASSRLHDALPTLLGALERGWNVLSTCEELVWPAATDPGAARELDARARAAGTSVLGAGVNPVFLLDALVLVLSALCADLDAVEVRRVVDTDQRRIPLQHKAGVGLSEEEFRARATAGEVGHVGLRQSALLVAHRLGWRVLDYREEIEPVLAPEDRRTALGIVPRGTVLGQRQLAELRADEGHTLRYHLDMHSGATPVDEVRLSGTPPVHQVLLGGVNGDVATEAVVANLVPVVAEARPGLLDVGELAGFACSAAWSPGRTPKGRGWERPATQDAAPPDTADEARGPRPAKLPDDGR